MSDEVSKSKVDMSLEEIIQTNKKGGKRFNNNRFNKNTNHYSNNNNKEDKISKLDQELPSGNNFRRNRVNRRRNFPNDINIRNTFRRRRNRNFNRERKWKRFDNNIDNFESENVVGERRLRNILINEEKPPKNGNRISISLKKNRIRITNLHTDVNNHELRVIFI